MISPVGPAAEIVVLVQDHLVEGVAQHLALADHVARRGDRRPWSRRTCAAGAGTCRWPRSRRPRRRRCGRSRRSPSRPWISKHVEAGRHLVDVGGERFRPGGGSPRAATPSDQAAAIAARVFSTWKPIVPPRVSGTRSSEIDRLLAVALGQHDLIVADEDRPAARAAMPHEHGMVARRGRRSRRRPGQRRPCGHQRIGWRSAPRAVGGTTTSTMHRFTLASVSSVWMSARPRWSPSPMLVTTATSQRSKPRPSRRMPPRAVSKHGRLDARVHQHGRGALRAAAIARVDAALVDVDAVGAGHAHASAGAAEDVGDEPRGGGLAVDAGDGDDGNRGRSRRPGRAWRRWPRPRGGTCPTEGSRCIRSPGAALTSTITPPCSSSGR